MGYILPDESYVLPKSPRLEGQLQQVLQQWKKLTIFNRLQHLRCPKFL